MQVIYQSKDKDHDSYDRPRQRCGNHVGKGDDGLTTCDIILKGFVKGDLDSKGGGNS